MIAGTTSKLGQRRALRGRGMQGAGADAGLAEAPVESSASSTTFSWFTEGGAIPLSFLFAVSVFAATADLVLRQLRWRRNSTAAFSPPKLCWSKLLCTVFVLVVPGATTLPTDRGPLFAPFNPTPDPVVPVPPDVVNDPGWLIATSGFCSNLNVIKNDRAVEVSETEGDTAAHFMADIEFNYYPQTAVKFTDFPHHLAKTIEGDAAEADALVSSAWDHKNVALLEPTSTCSADEQGDQAWGISVFKVEEHRHCNVNETAWEGHPCVHYSGYVSAETSNFVNVNNEQFICQLFVDSTALHSYADNLFEVSDLSNPQSYTTYMEQLMLHQYSQCQVIERSNSTWMWAPKGCGRPGLGYDTCECKDVFDWPDQYAIDQGIKLEKNRRCRLTEMRGSKGCGPPEGVVPEGSYDVCDCKKFYEQPDQYAIEQDMVPQKYRKCYLVETHGTKGCGPPEQGYDECECKLMTRAIATFLYPAANYNISTKAADGTSLYWTLQSVKPGAPVKLSPDRAGLASQWRFETQANGEARVIHRLTGFSVSTDGRAYPAGSEPNGESSVLRLSYEGGQLSFRRGSDNIGFRSEYLDWDYLPFARCKGPQHCHDQSELEFGSAKNFWDVAEAPAVSAATSWERGDVSSFTAVDRTALEGSDTLSEVADYTALILDVGTDLWDMSSGFASNKFWPLKIASFAFGKFAADEAQEKYSPWAASDMQLEAAIDQVYRLATESTSSLTANKEFLKSQADLNELYKHINSEELMNQLLMASSSADRGDINPLLERSADFYKLQLHLQLELNNFWVLRDLPAFNEALDGNPDHFDAFVDGLNKENKALYNLAARIATLTWGQLKFGLTQMGAVVQQRAMLKAEALHRGAAVTSDSIEVIPDTCEAIAEEASFFVSGWTKTLERNRALIINDRLHRLQTGTCIVPDSWYEDTKQLGPFSRAKMSSGFQQNFVDTHVVTDNCPTVTKTRCYGTNKQVTRNGMGFKVQEQTCVYTRSCQEKIEYFHDGGLLYDLTEQCDRAVSPQQGGPQYSYDLRSPGDVHVDAVKSAYRRELERDLIAQYTLNTELAYLQQFKAKTLALCSATVAGGTLSINEAATAATRTAD